MQQSNAEIVRRFYAQWWQGDLTGPREHMHPDIEYVNPHGAIEPGTRRGIDEFLAVMEKIFDTFEYWRATPEELHEVGDQVVAVLTYRLRGRASGVEITGRESALWTFRDGKVVRYEWFHGPDDAARAAGA